ncbi:MAG: DUF3592 domain-containing protein [Pseudomonadota bacterium]
MLVFNTPYRLLLFTSVTLLLIGSCFWIRFVNMPILEELNARGLTAQAQVVWVGEPYRVLRRGNYSRTGWRIDMKYQYRTQSGVLIEDEKTFVKQNAKRLTVGRTFDVVYLPDAPAIHNSAYGNGYAGAGMIYALLPLIAVCAFMTMFYWRRRPAEWTGPKLWPPIAAG